MSRILLVIFISIGCVCGRAVVKTKSGLVEGTFEAGENNTTYRAFRNIPYAKPPLGNLRFQPPVAIEPWNGTFNATNDPIICPQILDGTTDYDGDENCLVMNIYTPQDAKEGDDIPVIVYFIGGIYKFGNIRQYGMQYWMKRRIVFINVIFRLGVLGLFSTGDTLVPGNMAMKDQLLGLKWIKENVEVFGGNPNKITIMGHSSGASYVHFHTISPMSKGLFQRAIMQSGLSNSLQAFYDKKTGKSISSVFSERVGCGSNLTEDAINCLRKINAKELVIMANKMYVWENTFPSILFRPTIEDKNVKNPFLTEIPPLAAHPSNDIQMLMGITSAEGACVGSLLLSDSVPLDFDPMKIFPIIFYHLWQTKSNYLNFVSQIIKSHFFGEENVGPSTDHVIVDAVTGSMYVKPLIDAVDKFNGTKYVYYFDYDLRNVSAQYNSPDGYQSYFGVGHSDELALFFHRDANDGKFTENDMIVSDELLKRWINFAYSGNPNEPEPINVSLFDRWQPVRSRDLEFLHIQLEGKMSSKYLTEKYAFWNKIPLFSNYFE